MKIKAVQAEYVVVDVSRNECIRALRADFKRLCKRESDMYINHETKQWESWDDYHGSGLRQSHGLATASEMQFDIAIDNIQNFFKAYD